MQWEEAVRALTYGGGTLRQRAIDISALRGLRNNLEGADLDGDPEEHHEHRFLLSLDTGEAGCWGG